MASVVDAREGEDARLAGLTADVAAVDDEIGVSSCAESVTPGVLNRQANGFTTVPWRRGVLVVTKKAWQRIDRNKGGGGKPYSCIGSLCRRRLA